MTKEDNDTDAGGKRQISIRMPVELCEKVEAEQKRRGITTASPIYVEAVKFYFDNKDNPAYLTPSELDTLIENKMDELLADPGRIQTLRKSILRP